MKLNINHKNLLDIINLHYKSYYPIKSFVSKEDFLSIVNNYRNKNNLFFPMPIYINISEKVYKKIKNSKLIKTIYKSKRVCDLKINSFFQIDKYKIGKKIFQTNDKKHPGLNEFLKSGSFFIDCTIIKFNKKIMKNINFDNPQKLKSLFSKKKNKNNCRISY
jgi:sulfate adenylyltransferase